VEVVEEGEARRVNKGTPATWWYGLPFEPFRTIDHHKAPAFLSCHPPTTRTHDKGGVVNILSCLLGDFVRHVTHRVFKRCNDSFSRVYSHALPSFGFPLSATSVRRLGTWRHLSVVRSCADDHEQSSCCYTQCCLRRHRKRS
jgi:hypothetical protein